MYELFALACAANPAKPALVTPRRTFSYAELGRLVDGCAQQLARRVTGALVAFELERGEAVVLMLACLKIGKTFMPVDAGTAPTLRASIT